MRNIVESIPTKKLRDDEYSRNDSDLGMQQNEVEKVHVDYNRKDMQNELANLGFGFSMNE